MGSMKDVGGGVPSSLGQQEDLLAILLGFYQQSEGGESAHSLEELYRATLANGLKSAYTDLDVSIDGEVDYGQISTQQWTIIQTNTLSERQGRSVLRITASESGTLTLQLSLPGDATVSEAMAVFVELLTRQFLLQAQQRYHAKLMASLELTDSLTSLPNRRAFQLQLQERCQTLSCFALVIVNVDRFSRINDVMGSEVGDGVLVRVAGQLTQLIGPSDYLARINGDEFALILSSANEQRSQSVASAIHQVIGREPDIADRSVRCFVSIGISLCPETSLRSADLLTGAQIGLAEAKRARKGTQLYSGQVQQDLASLLLIESNLEAAIEQDQFELAAQPIFSVETGRLTELEILLRWTLPGHGPMTPEQFISVAEDIGLSERLDRYVMSKALAAAQGCPLPIAINLAAPTLYSDTFVPFVEALLDKYQRLPSQLGIEITERIIARPDAARATVEALGRMGVHIAIDDFGVGYSSLGILPELPISRLKVDKKFLLGKDKSLRYEEVIIGILRMASALGMESLVEGVEDARLMKWLSLVGCDFAQGYGLARPAPLAEVLSAIENSALQRSGIA